MKEWFELGFWNTECLRECFLLLNIDWLYNHGYQSEINLFILQYCIEISFLHTTLFLGIQYDAQTVGKIISLAHKILSHVVPAIWTNDYYLN